MAGNIILQILPNVKLCNISENKWIYEISINVSKISFYFFEKFDYIVQLNALLLI